MVGHLVWARFSKAPVGLLVFSETLTQVEDVVVVFFICSLFDSKLVFVPFALYVLYKCASSC